MSKLEFLSDNPRNAREAGLCREAFYSGLVRGTAREFWGVPSAGERAKECAEKYYPNPIEVASPAPSVEQLLEVLHSAGITIEKADGGIKWNAAPGSRERTLELRKAAFWGYEQEIYTEVGFRRQLDERFPLPMKVQPRVLPDVLDPNVRWCVRDGTLGYLGYDGAFRSVEDCHHKVTPERVAMWADLLKTPCESVPDEE